MRFELRGVEEALANLRSVVRQTDDRAMQEDALAALEPVVADAQSLAPVDQGDLRDSIEARVLDDGTVGVVIGDWKGHFFEFGTVKMRATPMLAPAFDANEDVVIAILGRRVGARIEGAV